MVFGYTTVDWEVWGKIFFDGIGCWLLAICCWRSMALRFHPRQCSVRSVYGQGCSLQSSTWILSHLTLREPLILCVACIHGFSFVVRLLE